MKVKTTVLLLLLFDNSQYLDTEFGLCIKGVEKHGSSWKKHLSTLVDLPFLALDAKLNTNGEIIWIASLQINYLYAFIHCCQFSIASCFPVVVSLPLPLRRVFSSLLVL